jgi:hypothetical protein
MMRLTDLEPRFYAANGKRLGFSFDCPHCVGSGQRLAIAVHLDGTDLDDDPNTLQVFRDGEHVWIIGPGVTGFEDMTLTPSVDASQHGHWHGFITAGEIV